MAEVREAADFCRYYAAEARRLFGQETILPGPTGEENRYRLRGRGVFVCISPWNFPLAIFSGQVAAALAAGNAVVAKPAEQTPLIAFEAVQADARGGHSRRCAQSRAGRRRDRRGARRRSRASPASPSPARPRSAQKINRALAAKDGPIVPLIAETGGINAMIADATALPEQVADDVVDVRLPLRRPALLRVRASSSCRRTSPTRCSAMIAGAAAELRLGDPADPATDVGPVIDRDAKAGARSASSRRCGASRRSSSPAARRRGPVRRPAYRRASTTRTRSRRRSSARSCTWCAGAPIAWTTCCDWIGRTGYGLTFGIHTRVGGRAERIARALEGRQRLREPQHDRRHRRLAALRRHGPLRHRAEGGRPELSAALRARAGRLHRHHGGRRERQPRHDGGPGRAQAKPA